MKKNTFDIIILIGRPASGKSEIIDYLKRCNDEKRSELFHVGKLDFLDDFPMLWAWFEEDYILEKVMGQPRLHTDSGGYFKYEYLWHLLIERFNLEYPKRLREENYHDKHTLIIEFSRGSEHGGYAAAFPHLSKEILEQAAIIYVNIPYEESLRKNRRRFNPDRPDSILEHGLPDEKLERLYKEVDWEEFSSADPEFVTVNDVKVPYVVFENEDDVTTDTPSLLAERLEDVLKKLWALTSYCSGMGGSKTRPYVLTMSDETYEITLEKFIYGGEAMGRLPDGRAVFVPYALPGERVRIRLTFEKKGFARAELLEVIETSPERIAPKCKHFGICQGCAYQHIPYKMQLKAKAEILKDQLTRIGKISNPPVGETVPSPQIWNYRNQMDFIVTERHPPENKSPNLLFLEECHLPAPAINEFWEDLEFGANDIFEQISLRQDAAENLMFVFYADNPETPEMSLEDDLSVVHMHRGEAIIMGGDDHLVNLLHGRPLRASPTSFSHPNLPAAECIITHLLETLPLTPQTTLLELHSGIGSFSAFLAGKVERLVCVDSDASACDDFAINLDEFENVELYQAPAEEVLPHIDFTPDILLVDPPVGGLGRYTLDGILALGSAELAYISRDPSTLARDAARLISGGYRLESVTPFDVAPHTAQIDSVAIFTK